MGWTDEYGYVWSDKYSAPVGKRVRVSGSDKLNDIADRFERGERLTGFGWAAEIREAAAEADAALAAEVERLTAQPQAAPAMTDAEYRTRVHAEIRRTLELFTPVVSKAVVRTVADAVLAIGVRA